VIEQLYQCFPERRRSSRDQVWTVRSDQSIASYRTTVWPAAAFREALVQLLDHLCRVCPIDARCSRSRSRCVNPLLAMHPDLVANPKVPADMSIARRT